MKRKMLFLILIILYLFAFIYNMGLNNASKKIKKSYTISTYQENDYFYLQKFQNSCGTAAIRYLLLKKYNLGVSENELLNLTTLGPEGLSMFQLQQLLGEYGIVGVGKKYENGNLENVNFPCLALINNNHFVVIINKAEKFITVFDPAVANKEIHVEISNFKTVWHGIVMETYFGPLDIKSTGGME